MSDIDEARPSFTDWFASTCDASHTAGKAANVTIARGAALIRADRDGRATTPE